MAYSRRYSRIFVTLKQERPDYCLNFRPAMGRCIIEIRNNKGKLLVYAQGLKPSILYKIYMVACEKDCSLAVPVELINIDNSGKGEVKCEFDPDNVFGTGYAIEKFKVIVIMVQGQNDIVVPMAGYIDNVVMWKNNFKYFSLDTNNKDSFGSEQAVEENDISEESKEDNLEIEPEEKLDNKESNNSEIPLNNQDESESNSIVNNEEITENKEVEDDVEQEQTGVEELNLDLDNKNTEDSTSDEVDIVDNKQETVTEIEDIKELSSESELEIDTTIENKEDIEDNTVDLKVEKIEIDTESKVLEKNKEKELNMNDEQYEVQEQITELNSDKIEKEHLNVELTEERKQDNISNTDVEQEKTSNTDSKVDLQNKVATSQDFYGADEDIEVNSTNEKIEEEKKLNNSFKSMIGKFKKEFDELKYYTFMTEEESKIQKQHFNYGFNDNAKFDDLDYMFKNNPRMTPFDSQDKDVIWIRIDIKELPVIQGDLWKYINNPFIDCSYRKYKHLLLGKYKENERDCYIFAVPGKYSSNYRLEASLQGFNKFKCCENKKPNENDYGYWILDTI